METKIIKFNEPSLVGNELKYINEAVTNKHISGNGPFTAKCEEFLQKELSVPRVLLTTSCTHALEMAAYLFDIEPGDEIIVPSFTFVSTINAFVSRGARPIFVDIRRDTLNINESKIRKAITRRTRAIIPVHYAGVGCEMDEIIKLAKEYDLCVIEDNAHGLFAKYKNEYLGTIGDIGVQSFHETKNITCGEGGALIINNPIFIERAEIIRDKGTNRKKFVMGQVDKYTWVDYGSSYVMSDILAAFLLAQLEQREKIYTTRKIIWEAYYKHLGAWAREKEISLPYIPSNCMQAYHIFYMVMETTAQRTALIKHLRDRGIMSIFHYQPLHRSIMGKALSKKYHECAISDYVADRLIRLPLYYSLSVEETENIIGKIKEFRG